ncbi:hypothetical protein [Maricaulis salignorans]|uniref:hypothetical protein n=1 Tax=Maricaulis salignorans TaxID=144026 RepID=UPI003A8E5237
MLMTVRPRLQIRRKLNRRIISAFYRSENWALIFVTVPDDYFQGAGIAHPSGPVAPTILTAARQ